MRMIDEADFDYAKFGYNETQKNGIMTSSLNISEDNNRFGFKKGQYRIVSCEDLYLASADMIEDITNQVIEQIVQLLKYLNISTKNTVLVCGLGNKDIMADSLGEQVCNKILSTRLLKSPMIQSKLCTLVPNVQTVTGIKTFDIVSGVAHNVNAKLVILVDSLLTNNIKRLGHSFQISSCGIVPGGAIKNNKEISYQTMGIKCITIGVPFMLDLKSISNKIKKNIIVCSKDIKQMINLCSKIIADSINILFNQNLKKEEIKELLNPF